MKILVERIANVKKGDRAYCIGHLYIDGVRVCDTIEDYDRGLDDALTIAENKRRKIYGQTAIPVGTYPVVTNIVSSTFYKYAYYRNYCYGKLPRILNVKAYDGILMHRGSNESNSAGCLILGYNTKVGEVTNSQKAFEAVYSKIKGRNDVSLTITRKYSVK